MTSAKVAQTVRRVQELENAAADKCGVGFLALKEQSLTGAGANEYATAWVERLLRSITPEAVAAVRLGRAFPGQVAELKESRREKMGGRILTVFRVKATLMLTQYGERLKVFIAENKLKGSTDAALKDQKDREFSRWTFNRDKLGKELKRETAGLINSLFHAAYLDGLKK